jgi:hypothetical protein
MQFLLPHPKLLEVTMLLKANGPLGIEIEPTIGLKTLAKFPFPSHQHNHDLVRGFHLIECFNSCHLHFEFVKKQIKEL